MKFNNTDIFDYEELPGNGYCTDSNNADAVARIYYKLMPHERARNICSMDQKCVAYTYALDYVSDSGSNNVVMYSSGTCTNDCSNTNWQDNPALIKQASNVHDYANWRTAKCYRKKVYTGC